MPGRVGRKVEILFRLSPESVEELSKTGTDFSGYEAEGDLAFGCNGKWLGNLADPPAPPADAKWFHRAFIWNFVWELAHGLEAVRQGKQTEIEVEGTPVRLVLKQEGDLVLLDERLVAPTSPRGARQLERFKPELVKVRVERRALDEAVARAIDQLLATLVETSPRIIESGIARQLRAKKDRLFSNGVG